MVEPARTKFSKMLVRQMSAIRMGDPLREDTDLGPLAGHDLRDYLHE